MSGYQRPRTTAQVTLHLGRLPANSSQGAQVNNAFTLLEAADLQNVKRNQETAFPSILLVADDGSTWRVTVSTTGVLTTAQVPR
jgi:hypothetical protein